MNLILHHVVMHRHTPDIHAIARWMHGRGGEHGAPSAAARAICWVFMPMLAMLLIKSGSISSDVCAAADALDAEEAMNVILCDAWIARTLSSERLLFPECAECSNSCHGARGASAAGRRCLRRRGLPRASHLGSDHSPAAACEELPRCSWCGSISRTAPLLTDDVRKRRSTLRKGCHGNPAWCVEVYLTPASPNTSSNRWVWCFD